MLIRIAISLIAFIVLIAVDKSIDLAREVGGRLGFLLPLFLYLAIYLTIGYDVLFRAVRNILHGQVFDENFLMVIATLGAFALGIVKGSLGQSADGFEEACAVLIFYQIGEFFQRYATGKSRNSISALMDIRPDAANVLREGRTETVDPSEVNIGEIIAVNPGEKIPLDGVCVKGSTSLDTKALTGESLPREIAEGDAVLSGCVNMSSQIEVRVEKEFYDSTVSKILDLVENATDKKSKTENFITKFAKYYTPAVVFGALALLVIPGAITGDWLVWTYRALSFLVVSCPCALVISIPLSFFAGIGASSRRHILIKGSDYLEQLARANIFVFDKTGTLTKGDFSVSAVYPEERRDEILRLAAVAEQGSSHPIARSIISAYGKIANLTIADGIDSSSGDTLSDNGNMIADNARTDGGYTRTDVTGKGILAKNGGSVILCGNEKLMREYDIPYVGSTHAGTAVYVAKDGEFVGYIVISDTLKPEAADVISELNAMGARTVMLTGDNEDVARDVAKKAGVSEYKSSLLPADKVTEVEKLISEKRKHDVVCFTGDGINDAPVLMRSDIGIAMGGVGSDAAIEASDVVLMQDDLSRLPLAKRIAKKTMRIAYQNIVFSIAVKLLILILSALGIADMWVAVVGDVGVSVVAILNSMRNLKYKTICSDAKK